MFPKIAFFCIPLHPSSQFLFAFERKDRDTRENTQLCWTRLLQGFINSPHIFGRTLEKELREMQFTQSTPLQYVNDLLIASPI